MHHTSPPPNRKVPAVLRKASDEQGSSDLSRKRWRVNELCFSMFRFCECTCFKEGQVDPSGRKARFQHCHHCGFSTCVIQGLADSRCQNITIIVSSTCWCKCDLTIKNIQENMILPTHRAFSQTMEMFHFPRVKRTSVCKPTSTARPVRLDVQTRKHGQICGRPSV